MVKSFFDYAFVHNWEAATDESWKLCYKNKNKNKYEQNKEF
jgi:hypothetical protein